MTDVAHIEIAGEAVKAASPGVSQTVVVDLIEAGDAHEGVIRGICIAPDTGTSGVLIGTNIKSKHLAEKRVDALCVAGRVTCAAAVAVGDVEITIRTEADPSAVVIAVSRVADGNDELGGSGIGGVGVGVLPGGGVSPDVIIAALRDEDEEGSAIDVRRIGVVVGMEGHSQKAFLIAVALPGGVKKTGSDEGIGALVQNANTPLGRGCGGQSLLHEEKATVIAGRRGQKHRAIQLRCTGIGRVDSDGCQRRRTSGMGEFRSHCDDHSCD